jgi:hypothetical protein
MTDAEKLAAIRVCLDGVWLDGYCGGLARRLLAILDDDEGPPPDST